MITITEKAAEKVQEIASAEELHDGKREIREAIGMRCTLAREHPFERPGIRLRRELLPVVAGEVDEARPALR